MNIRLLIGLLILSISENKSTVITVIGLMLITISVTAFALTGFDLSQVLGLAVGNIFVCWGSRLIDLENEINAEIGKLVDLKIEVRNKISNTYNKTYISVLTHLYINCLTLEQTAEKMKKDYSTICR